MQRLSMVAALAAVAVIGGCGQAALDTPAWFDTVQDPHPGDLNQAAWNLFLSRRDLEQAITIARAAYALDSGPSVADTLAQLLYVVGEVEAAIEIEQKAAAEAEGKEAEGYTAVVERMKAGEDMIDKPRFEAYPD